ncbi:MAG TPA: hypothetical protein VNB22_01905 [Pyrinomonadaceae bacterium]|nr:hypothetical protein [Pyrinomonadaceae bacterium]
MKLVFAVIFLAFCAAANFAQDDSIEKDFEKNKAKFKLEKFSEGEDASSGFYYLYYKNKTGFVKMRQAWVSDGMKEHDTYDYYFKDGKLILMVRYPRSKKQYKETYAGKYLLIVPDEKFYFTDSKMTKWIEKGKSVATDDKRWQEKEKEILQEGNDQLEYYKQLKEDNK